MRSSTVAASRITSQQSQIVKLTKKHARMRNQSHKHSKSGGVPQASKHRQDLRMNPYHDLVITSTSIAKEDNTKGKRHPDCSNVTGP